MTVPDLSTPEHASNAFYAAFARRDPAAMMAVWSSADDSVCIHPMSQRLIGAAAIRRSWADIFRDAPALRFRNRGSQFVTGATLAIETVVEVIFVDGTDTAHPAMLATNAFRLEDGHWRMVLHHAGPLAEDERGQRGVESALH